MTCKDCLKLQPFVLKHKKQKKYLTKQNKFFKKIILELIKTNEQLKNDLNIVLIKQDINTNDNIVITLALSVTIFGFLKCVKYLQNNVFNNNNIIKSQFDLDKIIYSIIILQIIYICIYLRQRLIRKT